MTWKARRTKSLDIEQVSPELISFHLGLEDLGFTPEGEEVIHALVIDGTLSLPALEIMSIEPRAVHHPYPECAPSLEPVRQMIGTRIGAGFRARVVEVMGREKGCTHFMTLLMDLSAAHTLSVFLRMRRTARYSDRDKTGGGWMEAGLRVEPRLENACVALRSDSPVMKRVRRDPVA